MLTVRASKVRAKRFSSPNTKTREPFSRETFSVFAMPGLACNGSRPTTPQCEICTAIFSPSFLAAIGLRSVVGESCRHRSCSPITSGKLERLYAEEPSCTRLSLARVKVPQQSLCEYANKGQAAGDNGARGRAASIVRGAQRETLNTGGWGEVGGCGCVGRGNMSV